MRHLPTTKANQPLGAPSRARVEADAPVKKVSVLKVLESNEDEVMEDVAKDKPAKKRQRQVDEQAKDVVMQTPSGKLILIVF